MDRPFSLHSAGSDDVQVIASTIICPSRYSLANARLDVFSRYTPETCNIQIRQSFQLLSYLRRRYANRWFFEACNSLKQNPRYPCSYQMNAEKPLGFVLSERSESKGLPKVFHYAICFRDDELIRLIDTRLVVNFMK